MNKFEKISQEQFNIDGFIKFYEPYRDLFSFNGFLFNSNDSLATELLNYDDIILPTRATKFSAGYDFYSLADFRLNPGESIKIPTGIKVNLDEDKFLMIVPRSGLGFKYRLQLDNTLGVIDSDYKNSDNEGHIWIKLTNDTKVNKTLTIRKGEAIAQGVIMQYFKTDDDNEEGVRNGGLGSTTSNVKEQI